MSSLRRYPNPFAAKIVGDAWESTPVDVEEIHAGVFRKCLEALDEVRRTGRTTSVLIHGEAGTGKTHLLARLRRTVLAERPDPWSDYCVFVWVKMRSDPRRLWPFLRRHLVADLLRPAGRGLSQLQWLLIGRLAELRPAEGDLDLWRDWIDETRAEELAELIDQVADLCDLDYNISTVLRHFAFKRHRRLASQWLRGDSLPEDRLRELGLRGEPPEDPEEEARSVVLALCRLAGQPFPQPAGFESASPAQAHRKPPRHPIVLCFDQVEALQRTPNDVEAMFAFGQLVSTLHTDSHNMLLVTCVQSPFLEMLRSSIRAPDYHRMGEYAVSSLSPLVWSQAVKLLNARLDSVPELRAARVGKPELWPLNEQELKEAFQQTGQLAARRLIELAASHFDKVRTGTAPTCEPLHAFLEKQFNKLVEQGLNLSLEQTGEVVSHGLPWLFRCVVPEWQQQYGPLDDDPKNDIDLRLVHQGRTVDISLCWHQNMISLSHRLRRLLERTSRTGPVGLVLVRHPQLPIPKTAKKSRERLKTLIERGARLIHPSPEVVAAIDALRQLLSDAKAGDLFHDGQAVRPESVEQWLRQNLSTGVVEFCRSVLESQPPAAVDNGLAQELLSLLAREHVISLEQAAKELGVPADRLLALAEDRPELIAVLSGPPAVLFELVTSATG